MTTLEAFEDLNDLLTKVVPVRSVCSRNDKGELRSFDQEWLEPVSTASDQWIAPHVFLADVLIANVPVHITIMHASINVFLDLVGTWGRYEYQWSRHQNSWYLLKSAY